MRGSKTKKAVSAITTMILAVFVSFMFFVKADDTLFHDFPSGPGANGGINERVYKGNTSFVAQWKKKGSSDETDKKDEKKDSKQEEKKSETPKYSNEWVNGKWYDADGSQTYTGTLSWKNDATGSWY